MDELSVMYILSAIVLSKIIPHLELRQSSIHLPWLNI